MHKRRSTWLLLLLYALSALVGTGLAQRTSSYVFCQASPVLPDQTWYYPEITSYTSPRTLNAVHHSWDAYLIESVGFRKDANDRLWKGDDVYATRCRLYSDRDAAEKARNDAIAERKSMKQPWVEEPLWMYEDQ
jgi:hypothetical protein